MTNLDTHEWDFCKGEKYAIKWWESHGYSVTLNKRFISKDYFTIEKDGFSMRYELPLGDSKINYGAYMQTFDRDFQMAKAFEQMKKEA